MTVITQAIETKYLGATNSRGGRIKATAWADSVTLSYDHELGYAENHRAAADALLVKLGWDGKFAQGGNVKGDGYVFVNVEGA
jgi:hypothetical protein